MATTNKDLNLPALNSTNWNVPLNENFDFIDDALGGVTTNNVTGVGTSAVVLTTTEYQKLSLTFTGTLTANVIYRVPAGIGGQWIIRNGTTGDFSLTFGISGGGSSVVIPQGTVRTAYSDGTDVRLTDQIGASIPDTYILYSDGTSITGSENMTYDGSIVTFERGSSVGSSVLAQLGLYRSTSGTPASGLGAGLAFYTDNSAGVKTYGAAVAGVVVDPTDGSEDYKLQFRLTVAGASPTAVAEIADEGITFKDNTVLTGRTDTDTAVQPLEYAGFTSTADNDGTISSGGYTPTPVGGNMKRIVNGGAFTFNDPTATGDYTMVVQITNDASAGAITMSGFNKVTGDAFTTTNGHDFFVYITKCNGFTLANVVALQ